MATHSSILAWWIPWTEKPGGLQFTGLHRVGQDWATEDAHMQKMVLPLWTRRKNYFIVNCFKFTNALALIFCVHYYFYPTYQVYFHFPSFWSVFFFFCKVDMIRVILLLKQMVRSCQNCSHSSTASFFPVSWPSKTGYLASTSAHMMLPLARSRTTPGSSETWGKRKEKSQNQPTGSGCQNKRIHPELRKRHSQVCVYTVTGSLQKLVPTVCF